MPVDRRDFGPCTTEPYTSVYATAVYNDESHTFEQVIQALQRSLDVGSREAVDLATCIDREGRSIVRCSSFQVTMAVAWLFLLVVGPHKISGRLTGLQPG